jgi:hypothetical protein
MAIHDSPPKATMLELIIPSLSVITPAHRSRFQIAWKILISYDPYPNLHETTPPTRWQF